MDSFRFAHPEALYLLLLVPMVLVLMWLFRRNRANALDTFGDSRLISHLMPDFSSRRSVLKAWLFVIALALQVVVVAGPQFGSKFQTVKRSGIEVMVALDVSNSMNAQDVSPSRLEVAKMAVARLVDKMADDRVGLVVFAGNAYVQM
ncbi:MAG: VWA domain-containing protein, partial [Bacteroidales bacterium]|nr:VWA domain-containing protein [Bacteroidales bacterium]